MKWTVVYEVVLQIVAALLFVPVYFLWIRLTIQFAGLEYLSKENMMKSLKMTLPKLQNFYMAGQWLSPGGGLPPAAQTGKFAVMMICKKEKKAFVVN